MAVENPMNLQEIVKAENRKILSEASFEVSPSPEIWTDIINTFDPSDRRISITSTPKSEPGKTLDLATSLVDNGFSVVPHIVANQVRSKDHLYQLGKKMSDFGIDEVFVIRGDGNRSGYYGSSLEIINDIAVLGFKFRKIGIAGHPEGAIHSSEQKMTTGIKVRERAIRRMGATPYIVTQMCFDPNSIVEYSISLRENGIQADIIVGLPVVEKNQDLYSKALKCGVGPSKRILLKKPEEYFDPGKLVDEIMDQGLGSVQGYHMYSFNQVDRLAKWFEDLKKI